MESLKHTGGVAYPNLDKIMFICAFATIHHWPEKHAQPLEQIRRSAVCSGFGVAAGWKVGDNDQWRLIYYLLCKVIEELRSLTSHGNGESSSTTPIERSVISTACVTFSLGTVTHITRWTGMLF